MTAITVQRPGPPYVATGILRLEQRGIGQAQQSIGTFKDGSVAVNTTPDTDAISPVTVQV